MNLQYTGERNGSFVSSGVPEYFTHFWSLSFQLHKSEFFAKFASTFLKIFEIWCAISLNVYLEKSLQSCFLENQINFCPLLSQHFEVSY